MEPGQINKKNTGEVSRVDTRIFGEFFSKLNNILGTLPLTLLFRVKAKKRKKEKRKV